jgi:hypothetical protein
VSAAIDFSVTAAIPAAGRCVMPPPGRPSQGMSPAATGSCVIIAEGPLPSLLLSTVIPVISASIAGGVCRWGARCWALPSLGVRCCRCCHWQCLLLFFLGCTTTSLVGHCLHDVCHIRTPNCSVQVGSVAASGHVSTGLHHSSRTMQTTYPYLL